VGAGKRKNEEEGAIAAEMDLMVNWIPDPCTAYERVGVHCEAACASHEIYISGGWISIHCLGHRARAKAPEEQRLPFETSHRGRDERQDFSHPTHRASRDAITMGGLLFLSSSNHPTVVEREKHTFTLPS
jgi:hypothetical protein